MTDPWSLDFRPAKSFEGSSSRDLGSVESKFSYCFRTGKLIPGRCYPDNKVCIGFEAMCVERHSVAPFAVHTTDLGSVSVAGLDVALIPKIKKFNLWLQI